MRTTRHSFVSGTALAGLFALVAGSTGADPVPPLIEFQSDTPALAAEVNQNFDDVKNAVDDNAADISQAQSDLAGKQDLIAGACPAGSAIRTISPNGSVTCESDDDSGGDITAVNVGAGLLGGGSVGAVTLQADTSFVQRRVSQSCAAGSAISAIAADGSVSCETDDDSGGDITAVNPGTGLTGGGSAGAVALSIATGGVTATQILDGAIGDADISPVAAIAISKILGESGVEFMTSGFTSFAGISGTVQNLGSIQLTAPGPGFVIVVHAGRFLADESLGDIGYGTTATAYRRSLRLGFVDSVSSTDAVSYTIMDVLSVSGGTVTFFALATRAFGTSFIVEPNLLAAVFVPTRY